MLDCHKQTCSMYPSLLPPQIVNVRQIREVFAQFKSLFQAVGEGGKPEIGLGETEVVEPKKTSAPSSQQHTTTHKTRGGKVRW